jgi:hypothetical protein
MSGFLNSFFSNPFWMAISGICTAITIIIWIIQVKSFIKNRKQTHHLNLKKVGKLIEKFLVSIYWLFCYLIYLLTTFMAQYFFWGPEKKSISLSVKILASIFSIFFHWSFWRYFKETLLPYFKK